MTTGSIPAGRDALVRLLVRAVLHSLRADEAEAEVCLGNDQESAAGASGAASAGHFGENERASTDGSTATD